MLEVPDKGRRHAEVLCGALTAVSFVKQGRQPMTKAKNAKLQKVIDVITDFVEGQLSKLPPEIAEAKRKEMSQILSSATRPARKTSANPSRTKSTRKSARRRA